MAVGFMLAWPYGFPRVMSSYYWDQNIQGGEVLQFSYTSLALT